MDAQSLSALASPSKAVGLDVVLFLFFPGPILSISWRRGLREAWGSEARGHPENNLP
jgi:hypothetical protein